jgi:hypothetical protein
LSCTLKMEAAGCSMMLVTFYQPTQCYIQEDIRLQSTKCTNSETILFISKTTRNVWDKMCLMFSLLSYSRLMQYSSCLCVPSVSARQQNHLFNERRVWCVSVGTLTAEQQTSSLSDRDTFRQTKERTLSVTPKRQRR